MVVQKAQGMRDGADSAHIVRDDFALPFGLEKIPIGFDLLGIDQFRIVSVLAAMNIALEDENILPVGIGVMMLAFPPFRFIRDFGKNQRRTNGFENVGLEINLNRRDHAIDKEIDEIFSGAPLGHHARAMLASAHIDNGVDLDLGIPLLKYFENFFISLAAIESNFALFLCR